MLAALIGNKDIIDLYKEPFLTKGYGISEVITDNFTTISEEDFRNHDLYRADILVTLCNKDSINSYITKLAKQIFSIPCVIALANNHHNYIALIEEGADHVISLEILIKNNIEQFIP